MADHYQVLELDGNASPEEVQAAFRRLGAENHPDRHPEDREKYEALFLQLKEAAQTLFDPQRRANYDQLLRENEQRRAAQSATAETEAAGEAAPEAPASQPEPQVEVKKEPAWDASKGKPHLDDLLRTLLARNGSDLHLKAGQPPVIRVHGHLQRMTEFPVVSGDDIKETMYAIMNEDRRKRFEENMELDMSYAIPGLARFRVNVFRQKFQVGAVLRQIPVKIKTIDEMKLPQVFKQLAMRPRGLFLVTGPTGSGKSTTLASIVDHINIHRQGHIITIEDPIEFVHQDKQCAVEQRELGQDTHSFADALKHVLRQNPDVILVGEMRDLETIALAITAAETGHLVFATLHTTDAAQTVDRIIDVFEPEQQEQIRTQLATTLLCVVSQTLLPLVEGGGRVPAFEIMVCTPAIKSLIREGKTHQMYTIIQTGAELGMIPLDQYLINLLIEKKVTYEQAVAKTSNVVDFEQRAKRAGVYEE